MFFELLTALKVYVQPLVFFLSNFYTPDIITKTYSFPSSLAFCNSKENILSPRSFQKLKKERALEKCYRNFGTIQRNVPNPSKDSYH